MSVKAYKCLQKVKPGDLVVVMGRFFDNSFMDNWHGAIYPTLILVREHQPKNGWFWFDVAVSYDDRNDRVLSVWWSDNFNYKELIDDGSIIEVCEPTLKQYKAIMPYLAQYCKDVEADVRSKSDTDYSQDGLAKYVGGIKDANTLATLISAASIRLSYSFFDDVKEPICLNCTQNDKYPLQVAIAKESDPLHVQTEFDHACFLEIHGLATDKQIAFRNYCHALMEYYQKRKSLYKFSDLSNKYGVTGLTKEQFHKYRFDSPEWVEAQGTDYIDKIYEEIKKR